MGQKYATTTATQKLPGYLNNAYQGIVGNAQQTATTPYNPYTGGFSQDQQQAFGNIRGLAGSSNPAFGSASGALGASMNPTYNTVGNYMSPYTQQVIQAMMGNMQEQNAQQQQMVIGDAISKGAMGGNRVGVAQAELARQQKLADSQALASLYNQNYAQGLGAAQADKSAMLQAAGQYAGLGAQQMETNLAQAGAQLGAGTQQQQFDYQQYLNQQAFPYQQQSWLAGITGGLGPSAGGTTTQQTPQGNIISQVLGAALGTASMFRDGGAVRRRGYAGGGVPYTNDNGQYPAYLGLGAAMPYFSPSDGNWPGYIPEPVQIGGGGGFPSIQEFETPEDPLSNPTNAMKKGAGNISSWLGLGQGPIDLEAPYRSRGGPVKHFANGGYVPDPPRIGAGLGRAQFPQIIPPEKKEEGSGSGGDIAKLAKLAMMFMADGGAVPRGGYQTGGSPALSDDLLNAWLRSHPDDVPLGGFEPKALPLPAPIVQADPMASRPAHEVAMDMARQATAPVDAIRLGFEAQPSADARFLPQYRTPAPPSPMSVPPQHVGGGSIPPPPAAALPPSGAALAYDQAHGLSPRPVAPPPAVPPLAAAVPASAAPVPSPAVTSPPVGEPINLEAPPRATTGLAGTPLPRSIRNNNPGNIKVSEWTRRQPGFVGSDGEFAIFDSPAAGRQAQLALLGNYIESGHNTITAIVGRWAPATDGNPTGAYVDYVARRTGLNPNEPLSPRDVSRVADAMAQFEGGTQSQGLGAAAPPLGQPGVATPHLRGEQFVTAPTPGYSQNIGEAFKSLRGGKGLNLAPDVKQGMLAAGLGMMASKSPFALAGIGEGGLKGIEAWNARQALERENFLVRTQGANQTAQTAAGVALTGAQTAQTVTETASGRYEARYTPAGVWIRDKTNPNDPGKAYPWYSILPDGTMADPANFPAAGAAGGEGAQFTIPRVFDPRLMTEAAPSVYAETDRTLAGASEEGRDAYSSNQLLANVEHDLALLPQSGLLTPGSSFDTRLALARLINTGFAILGAGPPIPEAEVAAGEDFNKLTTRLGQSLAGMLGSQPAATVVMNAISAVPNGALSREGNRIVVNALRAVNQRRIDYYRFMQQYAGRNMNSLLGAETAFNEQRPPELYAMSAYIPDAAMKALLADPSPEAKREFDTIFGRGQADMLIRVAPHG